MLREAARSHNQAAVTRSTCKQSGGGSPARYQCAGRP